MFRLFGFSPRQSLIVASIPRCGSTYLFRKLAAAPPGNTFPKQRNTAFAIDLTRLPNKRFIKTHSLPPKSLPPHIKTIFLYGDPYAAVASTLANRFDFQHFRNCGYCRNDPPDLLHEDALGYESMFDLWTEYRASPLLLLRYETMPQHAKSISEFVGQELDLSDFVFRSRIIPADQHGLLQTTYGRLRAKIDAAPDIMKIIPPKHGA